MLKYNRFLNENSSINYYEINLHNRDVLMSVEKIDNMINMYGIVINDIETNEVYLKANILNDDDSFIYMIDVEYKREGWATDFYFFMKKWWYKQFGKILKHSDIHTKAGDEWIKSLNENNSDKELCFKNNNYIAVNITAIQEMFVGEGIENIITEDYDMSITFVDNAWGGVMLNEWILLKEKYEKINKNGVEIEMLYNVSRNELTLTFEYVIELYNNSFYLKLKKNHKIKDFNL